MKRLLKNIRSILTAICMVWWRETRKVFRDDGVWLFFIVVPLVYPLLYSWIYNNEAVHNVEVAVVDMSHSVQSREFIRKCDASPELRVEWYCNSLDEAKELVGRQVSHGTIYIPADFAELLNRGEQAHISVLVDMAFLLNYKALYMTTVNVSTAMNAEIQVAMSQNYTEREEEILTKPLAFEEVTLFNPTGGYGNFILPPALILIIQQTLLLGIGMLAGTSSERRRGLMLLRGKKKEQSNSPIQPSPFQYPATITVLGKALCYFILYLPMAAYVTMAVPRFFNFTAIGQFGHITAVLLPFMLASIFFGMTISCLFRYRENVMLLIVFASVPLLFLSGISWPKSAIPGFLQGFSWLFPSTFAIQGFVRVNSMGATVTDVAAEVWALWIQVLTYFITACIIRRRMVSSV